MDPLLLLPKLIGFAGIFFGVCLIVILAILIDLWDGVYTARVTNIRVHSHKLRVTVKKISEYWRFVIIGFLIDLLGMLLTFYSLPFVAMAFGVGLVFVEIKSIFEHAHKRKSHAAKLPGIITRIIECAKEADARELLTELTSELEINPTTNEKN